MTSDLEAIRQRLDAIDRRILDALEERQTVYLEVAKHKLASGRALRDFLRERHQLTKLSADARARGLDAFFITRLFHQILDHSLRFQQAHVTQEGNADGSTGPRKASVAYQGRAGAYSEMAAEQHFGPQGLGLETIGHDSFAATLQAVADRHADYAMLPVENTTAGSINEAYDLLARMDLTVVGEEVLKVEHCLVGLPGASLDDIKRAYSHPQGLLQCSNFLESLTGCEVQAFTDTAMSVVKVRDEADIGQAAVASERAASLYQLEILARDIANQKSNYTRFMVVAREPITYDLRIPCKTSLIFATAHAEGALLRCLDQLAKRALNLTKLESRPRPGVAWEYLFYVDFEGNLADPKVSDALAELRKHTSFLKVLGSYPARTTQDAMPVEPQQALQGRSTFTEIDAATKTLPIAIGTSVVGEERPILIAGPPIAESRDQLRACAQAVRNVGADMLRAPCFRAQSAPGSDQGPGLGALAWIQEAGHATGLPVVTNVRDPQDVASVAQIASLIEIDADQMNNIALLAQLGRIDRPVLLRRGPDATIEKWLTAAAHITSLGNRQVILCEAGVTGPGGQQILDIATIATLRDQPLPVIADPSCAAVTSEHWGPVGRACLDAGAHGLLIGIHPNPDQSRTPALPSLDLASFERIVQNELLS